MSDGTGHAQVEGKSILEKRSTLVHLKNSRQTRTPYA